MVTYIEKTSEESAVKLKPFSGKEDNWVYWTPYVLGTDKGIENVPSNGDAEVKDLVKINLKQLNKIEYSELMVLMNHAEVAFMMVCKVHTTNHYL